MFDDFWKILVVGAIGGGSYWLGERNGQAKVSDQVKYDREIEELKKQIEELKRNKK